MDENTPPKFEGFELANTTPVPDILFDQLLTELSGSELKVLLYIIRRTWGFKKDTDAISLSQFTDGIITKDKKVLDKGCGIKNRTVVSKALASLECKSIIKSRKGKDPLGDQATSLYSIHFKGQRVVSKPYHPTQEGSIQTVPPVVTKVYHGSNQSVLGVVTESYPQETVIQLDSDTRNSKQEENVSASADSARTSNDASKQALHIATTDTTTTLLQAEHERETHNASTRNNGSNHHSSARVADLHGDLRNPDTDTRPNRTEIPPQEAVAQPELSTFGGDKPSRSRKPGKPKEPAVSPERIEAVFDCLDKMARQVTGDPSFKYDRSTKTSREKVAELLKDRIVTQEALEAVYLELWNTPPDEKTGFDWQKNMSVKAICNNFERVWLSIKGKIQTKQAQTQNGQKVSAAIAAGYTDYTNSPPVEYRPLRMPNDRKRA